MNDADLADEVITRLNKLIENPEVREDIGQLIETRVTCGQATLDHPTIQATELDTSKHTVRGTPRPGLVGFLGVLNGLVGAMPDGPKKGWGYVAAVFDDNMKLVRFERTVSGHSSSL